MHDTRTYLHVFMPETIGYAFKTLRHGGLPAGPAS